MNSSFNPKPKATASREGAAWPRACAFGFGLNDLMVAGKSLNKSLVRGANNDYKDYK